jgi:hypothetical protein
MKKANSLGASSSNIVAQLNSANKNDNHSHPQLEKRDASRLCRKAEQLTIWKTPQNPAPSVKLFRQKPQIVSISGISPKERHRYRVILGNEVLGDRLTLDEAIALANQSTHL